MHSIEPENYGLREACLLIVISDKHQVKNSPNPSGGRGKGERVEAVSNFFISTIIQILAVCVLSVDF